MYKKTGGHKFVMKTNLENPKYLELNKFGEEENLYFNFIDKKDANILRITRDRCICGW
jgi:hypothetical protein